MSDSKTITALSEALLSMAQRMIRQQRQFYPFGGLIGPDGEVEIVSGDLGHPWSDGDELARLLWDELGQRVQHQPADAIAVATDTGKAIVVEVQPRAADGLIVTQPYKKRMIGKDVEFGPPAISPAEQTRRWG